MHLGYKVLSNSSQYFAFISLEDLVLARVRSKVKCVLGVMVSLVLTVHMLRVLYSLAACSRICLAELGGARVQFTEGSATLPSAN